MQAKGSGPDPVPAQQPAPPPAPGRVGFGPQMAHAHGPEVLRATLGALLGLGLAAGLLMLGQAAGAPALGLIAPFGASTVLIFAASASPLAQPWPVVVGNLVSALVALAVVAVLPPGPWLAPVAVALAIAAMMGLRALHPPGGAVALLVALTVPEPAAFLVQVLAGSVLLVAAGVLWGLAAARPYPHAMNPARPPAAAEPAPLGLDPEVLVGILEAQEQTANLGPADLARLIEAAEEAAGADRLADLTCADVMTAAPVVLAPADTATAMAAAFGRSGFSALPVCEAGRYLGIIAQIDLIRAMGRPDRKLLARDLMHAPEITPGPDTPLAALIAPVVHRGAPAVPVLAEGRLVGMVTRRALTAALVRMAGRGD